MYFLAQAAPPSGGGPGFLLQYFPIIIFFVVFILLFVLPARKRQKQLEQTISGLKPGDRVVTNSGMYGVVTNVTDRILKIRIANNVVVDMDKSAVAGLAEEQKEEKKEKEK